MRSYTVVGAGAVGLLYGARLAAAGHPVTWVVRSGLEEIRSAGISVTSAAGDITLEPGSFRVTGDPGAAADSDVVIVALKTTANDALEQLVSPAVGPGTMVAMFQNGLGVEEQMRAAAPGAGPIVGALCFVCAHRSAPGTVEHLDYGSVTVAGLDDGSADPSAAAEAIAEDLESSGSQAASVDDLGVARWRKLVWNIPFNGLSVVLDTSTDSILAHEPTRALVADLMDEVIAAADALGHPIDPRFRDEMLLTTDAMTPYAPSMKLDHDAGRAMEIEAIYDAPIAAAASAGAVMSKVSTLRDQLRDLDTGSG